MNYTLENFINFCDDMEIVQEAKMPNIKTIIKTLIDAIKRLLGKIADFFAEKMDKKEIEVNSEYYELYTSAYDKLDNEYDTETFVNIIEKLRSTSPKPISNQPSRIIYFRQLGNDFREHKKHLDEGYARLRKLEAEYEKVHEKYIHDSGHVWDDDFSFSEYNKLEKQDIKLDREISDIKTYINYTNRLMRLYNAVASRVK